MNTVGPATDCNTPAEVIVNEVTLDKVDGSDSEAVDDCVVEDSYLTEVTFEVVGRVPFKPTDTVSTVLISRGDGAVFPTSLPVSVAGLVDVTGDAVVLLTPADVADASCTETADVSVTNGVLNKTVVGLVPPISNGRVVTLAVVVLGAEVGVVAVESEKTVTVAFIACTVSVVSDVTSAATVEDSAEVLVSNVGETVVVPSWVVTVAVVVFSVDVGRDTRRVDVGIAVVDVINGCKDKVSNWVVV